MSVSKKDSERIAQLVSEGKQIKKIRSDYFPHLSYAEVQAEAGKRNALGVMRMITARIDLLTSMDGAEERKRLAEELKALTKTLYKNHKLSHEKLTQIREALDA
jgi:hypothetical protein